MRRWIDIAGLSPKRAFRPPGALGVSLFRSSVALRWYLRLGRPLCWPAAILVLWIGEPAGTRTQDPVIKSYAPGPGSAAQYHALAREKQLIRLSF